MIVSTISAEGYDGERCATTNRSVCKTDTAFGILLASLLPLDLIIYNGQLLP